MNEETCDSRKRIIPWPRFWIPVSQVSNANDDGDYLPDPNDQFGRIVNRSASSLEKLLPENGPLVLCGEPGIGKSTELKILQRRIANTVGERGTLISVLCREVADFASFREKTVATAEWRRWREENSRLTLLVDGVDEGLLHMPNFLNELIGMLREQPCERMRLVLACRIAEWPVDTGNTLLSLWRNLESRPIYELCRLRRVDVEEAARFHDCDPAAFMSAVWEQSVVGLAARPVTLFFLLREFCNHAGLPGSHRELYEHGTAELAKEIDPVRAEYLRGLRRSQSRATDADRLRAAQRLAATLLLSGHSAVHVSSKAFEAAAKHDLDPHHAADSPDSSSSMSLSVSMAAIEEALETGLFTSAGERRLSFVHQTFAECLGAQHLQDLPLIQLRKLLCRHDQRGEHVVPHLEELAAWVSGYNTEFLEHLLRIAPEVLLRSDVTRLQGNDKERLVEAVLMGAQREEIFDQGGFYRFFHGLKHPGLAGQLRGYINNPAAGFIVRRISLTIAARCGVEELTEDILRVVMDSSEDGVIRDFAVQALIEIVPKEKLSLLEPLGRGGVEPDSRDFIQGYALQRLVPGHWKVREILSFLGPTRNDNFGSPYNMFLTRELPNAIEDADVTYILAFMQNEKGCLDFRSRFQKLTSAAFARGLKLFDDPAIADVVVKTWQAWSKDHETCHLREDSEICNCLAPSEEAMRHRFAAAVLNHPETSNNTIDCLFYSPQILSGSAGLDWLLDQILFVDCSVRNAWVRAIAALGSNPPLAAPCWDKLLDRIEHVPELASQFQWLTAWNINDARSRKAKADWLRQKRRYQRLQDHRNARLDLKAEIQISLARIRYGDPDAWAQLWHNLSYSDHGPSMWQLNPDVTKYPGWQQLTDDERRVCVEGARAFLISNADVAPTCEKLSNWLLAGAAAVWLCRDRLELDKELLAVVVTSWLRSLVTVPGDKPDQQREAFRLAYRLDPKAAIRELLHDAAEDISKHRHPMALRAAGSCWDERLSAAVADFLDSLHDPKAIRNGIAELASLDNEAAITFIIRKLRERPSALNCYPIHLFGVLAVGLLVDSVAVWALAKPVLESDDDLAKQVWIEACYHGDVHKHFLTQLAEADLADCFLMLRRLFPLPSPKSKGTFLAPADSPYRVADAIPGQLANCATESASKELLRLAAMLPKEATWLRWCHRTAVTNIRRNRWQPPTPSEIVSMFRNRHARLVNSVDDLQEVVVESLERLQRHLTGQKLPAVEDLWAWEGGGQHRRSFHPKDEEAVSDYVARWISKDLGLDSAVIINREVQPRRGKRLDVLVEARLPDGHVPQDVLTVVVEVKGCWNDKVSTALCSQLVDSYMKPNGWTHGIYLVCWFVCPQWENGRNSLVATTYVDAKHEVERLAEPFDGRTNPVVVKAFVLDCGLR
jgi:hypothetical protein